jgi:hypothetical protein
MVVLAACRANNLFLTYLDKSTGYWVGYNWRYNRGAAVSPWEGEQGEPGDVNPAVIEYLFAAPESPFTRYYDLVLGLPDRPSVIDADLTALAPEATKGLDGGASPRGRDYARALGRKLARPIRVALQLSGPRVGLQFEGTASVHWGIPVDLDTGVPLLENEREGQDEMQTMILRYQSARLLVMRSSATYEVLVWDVSGVPDAFAGDAALDPSTVAAQIVALHPPSPDHAP